MHSRRHKPHWYVCMKVDIHIVSLSNFSSNFPVAFMTVIWKPTQKLQDIREILKYLQVSSVYYTGLFNHPKLPSCMFSTPKEEWKTHDKRHLFLITDLWWMTFIWLNSQAKSGSCFAWISLYKIHIFLLVLKHMAAWWKQNCVGIYFLLSDF